jgi:hypothetical protein
MKPLRETLFGMVDAVSNAKRRAWLDRMRACGRRLIEEISDAAMFSDRPAPHGRENGREHLKMAASLEFCHVQPAAWK